MFDSSCDIAKAALARAGIAYTNVPAGAGAIAVVRVGERGVPAFEGDGMDAKSLKARSDEYAAKLSSELVAAGYPATADPERANVPMLLAILTLLVVYVTLVYGPIAAWLVELFPTRIRYSSMSLPYHIGNGWFGGFLPTIAFAMVVASGDIYRGLWYPIVVAAITAVVGFLFLPETKDVDITR